MKSYGQGYVNFVKGLLFDQCANEEEFRQYDCAPEDEERWEKLLGKVNENPLINGELDRILELHKFPQGHRIRYSSSAVQPEDESVIQDTVEAENARRAMLLGKVNISVAGQRGTLFANSIVLDKQEPKPASCWDVFKCGKK